MLSEFSDLCPLLKWQQWAFAVPILALNGSGFVEAHITWFPVLEIKINFCGAFSYLYLWVYVCVCVCLCVCVSLSLCIYVYLCVLLCMCLYVYICVCVYLALGASVGAGFLGPRLFHLC